MSHGATLAVVLHANDVAKAYGHEPRDDDRGAARVALRYEPATEQYDDDFVTLVAPADADIDSHGEWLGAICAGLFGSESEATRSPRDPDAMDRAVETARASLPQARRRFVNGELPLGDELLVKWRLEVPGGNEYLWAFVTDWPDAETIRGTSANDAHNDDDIRVGSPLRLDVADVVDWAIWREDEIVEGAWTNAALE